MVQVQATKVILTGSSPIAKTPIQKDCMTKLHNHPFAQIWHWEITAVGNLTQLVEDIITGCGFAMSDGWYQAWSGAAAWIIKWHDSQNWLVGMCFSPSNADGHSSFRSKLAGIYMILFTLNMILPHTAQGFQFCLACNWKLVLAWLK